MTAIEIGRTGSGQAVTLPLKFANRHGLVTGATGTGKTVTLQRLAEGFSAAGVPVFAADIKGDLSGIANGGAPVELWDVFADHGLPVHTSVHDLGHRLLARMLNLNDTQEGALAVLFRKTRDEETFLFDLEALQVELIDMMEQRQEVSQKYGNVTASSVNTIQRNLLALESQGGSHLFGEPPLDINDFMRTDGAGRGVVNLLHADNLMEAPKLYATLLLWMLTELFRKLPEAGDLDKPRLVFFFDEAHLLFKDAPKHLIEQVERLVRLVRSKGVGVYFVTQTASDVPDTVLAQLGNRIQHALRAYTPKDQRFVKASARAFRPNPAINVEEAILQMGVGEALVSTLIADGVPSPVERIKVQKPVGQIGPISTIEREAIIERSPLRPSYPIQKRNHAEHQFMQRVRAENGLPPLANRDLDATGELDWRDILRPLSPEPTKKRGTPLSLWLLFGVCAFVGLGALLT